MRPISEFPTDVARGLTGVFCDEMAAEDIVATHINGRSAECERKLKLCTEWRFHLRNLKHRC
jgi:hypothetical protein